MKPIFWIFTIICLSSVLTLAASKPADTQVNLGTKKETEKQKNNRLEQCAYFMRFRDIFCLFVNPYPVLTQDEIAYCKEHASNVQKCISDSVSTKFTDLTKEQKKVCDALKSSEIDACKGFNIVEILKARNRISKLYSN